jgi:hypothetical protein
MNEIKVQILETPFDQATANKIEDCGVGSINSGKAEINNHGCQRKSLR